MDQIDSAGMTGYDYPPGPADQDWGWPSYDFLIPQDWPSGAYVAVLVEIGVSGGERIPDVTTPDGRDAKVLFVVRSARPGRDTRILYKLPWFTFHAYNGTGHGSLYGEAIWADDHLFPGFKVTMRRPGGGTGGVPDMSCPPDYYDQCSPRNTFTHWDAPMVAWLAENGYPVDYCTDLDVHLEADLLSHYSLLLSVGHDEYWSPEMRAAIDSFVGKGGNIAYFSGNICSGSIQLMDGGTSFTCAKISPPNPNGRQWSNGDWTEAGDPEDRTTGVNFYQAGGRWDGKRQSLGYTVQHVNHWVFAGTGLADGDEFGAGIVGYENDGAEFVKRDGIAVPTGARGTPPSFFILGVGEFGEDQGWVQYSRQAAATMGVYTSAAGGIIFQGATTDWAKLIGRNDIVDRITENVLAKLSLRSVRVLGPLPGRAGRMIAEVGKLASFHIDLYDFPANAGLRFSWETAGGEVSHDGGSIVEVQMPAEPIPVTVSVTVSDNSGPIAFGSCTFIPLTRESSLQLEIAILAREIATRGADPTAALIEPFDPLQRSRALNATNVQWIHEKAARLVDVTNELLEMWLRTGTRGPVMADPRQDWLNFKSQ